MKNYQYLNLEQKMLPPEAEQAAEAVIAETKQVLACKILKDIERGS